MTLVQRWRKTKPWLVRIGIVLGVWLLFVLLLNYVVMPVYVRTWSEITVPDLTGLTIEEAGELADDKHVRVVLQDSQFVAEIEPGTVLEQFPMPGLEAKPGRRVQVIVSTGSPTTEVPGVVGKSREEAVFTMEAAGLEISTIHYAFSDSVFENQVMQQRPEPGVVLDRGSEVRITVSLGKEPTRFIVPDVLDLPLEQARYLILKAGLEIGSVSYDKYVGRRRGAVMNQSPAPKTRLEQGDRVMLEVNYPPGQGPDAESAADADTLDTDTTDAPLD